MSYIIQTLRRAGFWILLLTELALIGLFSSTIAVGSGGPFEVGSLILHCGCVAVILGTELLALWYGGRDPYDITYCVSSGNVLIFSTISAILFTIRFVEGEMVHFGDSISMSYAMLILSWLSVVFAMESMVFSCIDKRHAEFGQFKGRFSGKVDWSQRPLPLRILNVQQNTNPALFIHPEKPHSAWPQRTTYNSWPDINTF